VLCRGLEKNGMVGAWHGHGMASVNQTQPHCVNQMGKTHSKPLAARHAICESAFSGLPLTAEALFQSQVVCGGQSGRGTGLSLSTFFFFCHHHFPCSILISMLLLPERQTGDAWGLSKKLFCFVNWGALDRKSLFTFFFH
jgi:hypothetical protein